MPAGVGADEKQARYSMLERLADYDDELMEQLLNDIEPPRDKVFDDLARDLRRAIRQRVLAGQSNKQIIDWMTARYGNFIRLRPPLDGETIALWGAPVIALAVGAGVVLLARRQRPGEPPPLSAAERERLMRLLD